MKKIFICFIFAILGLNSVQGFAETSVKRVKKKQPVVLQETVGQRFNKALADLKAQCEVGKQAANVCNLIYLQPYNSTTTAEGRYANSINFPELQGAELYRPGMTSEQYFNTLCTYEAGESIIKPVENVQGIFLIRPREVVDANVMQHLYAMEDPYGYQVWEATRPQDYFVQPPTGKYLYLETQGRQYRKEKEVKDIKNGKFVTAVIDGKSTRIPYMVLEKSVDKFESQYGYVWRAIRRTKDRELGIAGSELIILDLKENKILAFRRGFVRGVVANSLTGISWSEGQRCPHVQSSETYTLDFIYRVLRPALNQ